MKYKETGVTFSYFKVLQDFFFFFKSDIIVGLIAIVILTIFNPKPSS